MTYRLAQSAKGQHNTDASKLTEAQAKIMIDMARILEERQDED